jgi:quinol monooxygenase YgiN
MQQTTPFSVWVEFQIKPGAMPAFMPLMLANAQASLSREPGCRQFEVMQSLQDKDTVLLFEIYDSRAAFDEHLDSAHFKQFAAQTAQMIVSRRLLTADIVPGSPGRDKNSQ